MTKPITPTRALKRIPDERDILRGFAWAIAAMITASIITIAIRVAGGYIGSTSILLIRFWITVLLCVVALAGFASLRGQLRFSQPKQHIARGVAIAIATHLGFYAITTVPLAAVSALFFTAPIFAAILGIFVHGEKIGIRRGAAIAAGFIGVLIFLRPGAQEINIGVLSAVASSLFYASALIMSRGLADEDGVFSTFVSASVIGAIYSSIVIGTLGLTEHGGFAMPIGWLIWSWLALVVAVGIARQFCDIQAYRFGEAAVIAPVSYLRLVFIGIVGYFFFDETPSLATISGAAIITLATLYMAHRESVVKKNSY